MNVEAARPRVLPVVILALVALAVFKAANLIVSFSPVSAAEDTPEAPAAEFAVAPAPAANPSEAEKRILTQLSERRTELDAREEAIATRERLLQAAEQRLEARLASLAVERDALAALTAKKDASQREEFSALSNAYEKMKARDAARIFDVLEEDILVPVASGMRTQSLAGVLAEMDPDKARRLTRLLADKGGLKKPGAGSQ